MNIDFLSEIYNNKDSEYYIVEAWGAIFLVNVPSRIRCKRHAFGNEELKTCILIDVLNMNETQIDGNMSLTGHVPPFQIGMSVGMIRRFKEVTCGMRSFLELSNNPELDFYGFCKLIEQIKKEEEEAKTLQSK